MNSVTCFTKYRLRNHYKTIAETTLKIRPLSPVQLDLAALHTQAKQLASRVIFSLLEELLAEMVAAGCREAAEGALREAARARERER